MEKPIPYGKQQITKEDINAVIEVLNSDFLTQGPVVEEFEKEFAKFTGSKYAIAVANGTAALHLSALALNINPGDKVITSPITFVASANAVLFAGGEIDFVDINPDTYTIDIDKLEKKLNAFPQGTYKGIIPVDFAGLPVNTEKLKKLADKYNLWILEDACHAPGGYFTDSHGNKQKCGNGKYSDLNIFSFHPVKHIAAGEGGMVTTNNRNLYERIKKLRTHGITKQKSEMTEYHGPWYYEMQELGFNYRLSELHAALGLSQLKKIEKNLKRRNEIAQKYNSAFKNNKSIKIPYIPTGYFHAFHLYVIQVPDRKGLYEYLREHKIFAQVHYIPVHLQPYYKKFGWKKGDFPVAEEYYEHALSLPMYHSMSDTEVDYVIETVLKYVK